MTRCSTSSADGGAPPVALVTGASRGIGREIAALFVARGYRVVGTSRSPETLAESDRVPGVEYVALELGDEQSMVACAAQAGPVDVLVNNAGQSQLGALEDVDPELLQRMFAINVFGQVRMIQLCLPAMRARRRGTVVVIGSLMADFPVPFQSTYAATKLAMRGFVQSVRREVRPFGIRVVLIQPGYYATEIRHAREHVVPAGSAYARATAELGERIDRSGANGAHPGEVAEKVWDVVSASDPAPVHTLGSHGPAMVFAKRFVSTRFVERLVARRYGL
jgi:NAD(P)-dependent dehydrogenase (short-subunit alcohol dehydrogenase family)